jgi:hypothetical protein
MTAGVIEHVSKAPALWGSFGRPHLDVCRMFGFEFLAKGNDVVGDVWRSRFMHELIVVEYA